MDSEDRLRATGALYQLSPWLSGRIAKADLQNASAPEQDDHLQIIPLVRTDGGRSLLMINQGEASAQVSASGEAFSSMTSLATIDFEGLHISPFDGEAVSLPGWSVALLTDAQLPWPAGSQPLPGQHVNFDW
jgi:hypothetical protein